MQHCLVVLACELNCSVCCVAWFAEDGLATEDDEDDTDLPPAEMHAEPASTAEAAQHAAQVAASVRQAELQERSRLEEDAIGMCFCVTCAPAMSKTKCNILASLAACASAAFREMVLLVVHINL